MKFLSSFVAIIGPPNVGKSTLLNRILGTKLAIVSPKPQTTRNRIIGIYHGDGFQIVFMDTPGIHVSRTALHKSMVASAQAACREVFEETGLTRLQGIMAIGYAFSFDFDMPREQSAYAPDVRRIVNTVLASEVVSAKPVALSPEHIDYGWFSYEEALTRIHWPEEKEALVRLHPMILSTRRRHRA